MRKADDWPPALIDLVKDIITEKLDNISVPSFAPSSVPREPESFGSQSSDNLL